MSRMVSHAIGAIMRAGRAPGGQFISANDLISKEELPAHYRHTLLHTLAGNGFLRGDPKREGRYALATPLKDIRLLTIIEIVDGPFLKLGDIPKSLREDIGPELDAEFDVLAQTVRDSLQALTMDRFKSGKENP